MADYGPNSEEVERFIADAGGLTAAEFDEVGRLWRQFAVPHITGPPDVNLNIAAAIEEARTAIEIGEVLARLTPEGESPQSLPLEHNVVLAMRAAADARAAAESLTTNEDAKTAIGAMCMVVALQPWIRRPIVENALAPFLAVRQGWLGD